MKTKLMISYILYIGVDDWVATAGIIMVSAFYSRKYLECT